jgi:hypothetical protein
MGISYNRDEVIIGTEPTAITANRVVAYNTDGDVLAPAQSSDVAAVAAATPIDYKTWTTVADAYGAPTAGAWVTDANVRIRVSGCDSYAASLRVVNGEDTTYIFAQKNIADCQWFFVASGSTITAQNITAGETATKLVVQVAEVA